ncbi:hypothetical protein [Aliarcobacter skirrowii]|uniref:Uncharacterized protein n=1 Tax=Aliarcobacter skirrowii CCUG 10374 TaxID=1032239 RepID=A0AAD0SKS5_9BACT|nr:hypothetical protein [Aliarcobacter skirrowii]AXX84531.1 hypothetical protein ASKIR_0706 [Aliarcobacter skirrowii CCUG 10374]KAB0621297.1 hypothetical protein F7P70_00185 [Aliarcobacter skirrowii CCUG 10374]MDX4049913.1 hypothetical protein [Aliarcobacter skirrowii]RXI26553.1 hypothetical protein CP959_00185 [Aliarcobacter skirrowii CCUG 10374]SUV14690.1 Uncharacterised protein [Aliarcobacter skirrowii]
MEVDIFEQLLKKANLTKKEFSILVKMNYTSVTNWNGSKNVPDWVESWLENYIKAKVADDIIKAIEPLIREK